MILRPECCRKRKRESFDMDEMRNHLENRKSIAE